MHNEIKILDECVSHNRNCVNWGYWLMGTIIFCRNRQLFRFNQTAIGACPIAMSECHGIVGARPKVTDDTSVFVTVTILSIFACFLVGCPQLIVSYIEFRINSKFNT